MFRSMMRETTVCLNCVRQQATFYTSCHRKSVRVRFAPSPTGFLHIGGLRTALINFLFAKSKGGKFIIRIEDTDQTRVVPGAVSHLIEQLKWVGISPDEGPSKGDYGPYVQSNRLHIYKRYADDLLESGSAYPCFCSERRLEIMRRDQKMRNERTRYDNRCRFLSKTQINEKLNSKEPCVLRLLLDKEVQSFHDLFNGEIAIDVNSIEGDPVIFKSDGYPTYHLANVIDDHLMGVTHVLRGKEWINSTPKHIMLYSALGWKPPKFGHLPLFLNEDGKKLSKRQGDVFVEQFRKKGYQPSALLNLMLFCGAGFSSENSVMGDNISSPESVLKEMVNNFSLDKIGTTDSVLQFWKLDEFNSDILKHLTRSRTGLELLTLELKQLVTVHYPENNVFNQSSNTVDEYLRRILVMRAAHIKTIKCLVSEEYDFVWRRPTPKLEVQQATMKDFVNSVSGMLSALEGEIEKRQVTSNIRQIVKEQNLKMPAAMTLLRLLLSGRKDGPGVAEIITIVGLEEAVVRLNLINKNDHDICRSHAIKYE